MIYKPFFKYLFNRDGVNSALFKTFPMPELKGYFSCLETAQHRIIKVLLHVKERTNDK